MCRSSTRPLNFSTRSAIAPSTTKAEKEKETITNLVQDTKITTAGSSIPQTILLLSSSEDGDTHNLIGNWTIIGSIVGSVFAVLIVIVTIVVIRFRRRSKAREDSNSKSHINANNSHERKTTVNNAYVDTDGDYSHITTIPTQSYEQVTGTYAVANKNNDSCGNIHENLFDIPSNEKQPNNVLYSVVQKKLRTEGGNEEYDKISFGKAIQVEQNGHVYNKVKFHCDPRDRPTGNVYDKANFHRKPRDEHGGTLYDKADFNRLPAKELRGNVYDKANR
ncbi:hypothetical protein CHS0354_005322 [Potamilus streckersoni]|uniref:Uncharacterized protein n=1 Tax=Potamilus streckersoni TaxID=2493646 RepID=A0AAE0SHB7_9BIVA|nr:hypothetical protein CHS0354_005322 [Potamilus streckersoni]